MTLLALWAGIDGESPFFWLVAIPQVIANAGINSGTLERPDESGRGPTCSLFYKSMPAYARLETIGKSKRDSRLKPATLAIRLWGNCSIWSL